jgi:hypothetical protein
MAVIVLLGFQYEYVLLGPSHLPFRSFCHSREVDVIGEFGFSTESGHWKRALMLAFETRLRPRKIGEFVFSSISVLAALLER